MAKIATYVAQKLEADGKAYDIHAFYHKPTWQMKQVLPVAHALLLGSTAVQDYTKH